MASTNTGSSFEDLIQSKLFTFRVGKEKKEFVVHSGPIAATSPQLNALINGGMSESQTDIANFDDIEPADFARFIEYAYRYDYTSPACVLDDKVAEGRAENSKEGKAQRVQPPPSLSIKARNAMPQVQPQQNWSRQQHLRSQTPPPVTLQSKLLGRSYLGDAEPKFFMLKSFEHQSNTAPEQNFAPVFLAHAWLYTFACERLIDPLKRLALSKLHQTLLNFTPYQQRLVDVVELIRYAYGHGADRKDDGTVEELRKLVTEYVGSEISVFEKDKDFVHLLQEGQEFAVDLVRVITSDRSR